MIPFFIRLHFKFTFTFTFLYQKLPVFCNFCYRLTILLPLKFFFTFLPFYSSFASSEVNEVKGVIAPYGR